MKNIVDYILYIPVVLLILSWVISIVFYFIFKVKRAKDFSFKKVEEGYQEKLIYKLSDKDIYKDLELKNLRKSDKVFESKYKNVRFIFFDNRESLNQYLSLNATQPKAQIFTHGPWLGWNENLNQKSYKINFEYFFKNSIGKLPQSLDEAFEEFPDLEGSSLYFDLTALIGNAHKNSFEIDFILQTIPRMSKRLKDLYLVANQDFDDSQFKKFKEISDRIQLYNV